MENEEKIWIGAIDPGKNNFAFIIEEIDVSAMAKLPKVMKKNRYEIDGTPSEEWAETLSSITNLGRTIVVENKNVTTGTANKRKSLLDKDVFMNLTRVLDDYSEYWDKCSYIIIEQQMSFGRKHNTMAIKIAQHTYSYFIFKYGNFKFLHEVPSYYKTQVLGAEKQMDKPARKKWAVVEARKMWEQRKDEKTIQKLDRVRKRDDMSDCLLMTTAFAILRFIDKKDFE
jgi:hypothetical protein